MRVLDKQKDIQAFLRLLRKRASGGTREVEERVKRILADVRKNGDRAVISYTENFDSSQVKGLRITPDEIKRHANRARKDVVLSLTTAARRIRAFHELQREESWFIADNNYKKIPLKNGRSSSLGKQSASHDILGQIIRPLDRVGVYVPGGTAAYPSTVLMNVIPAQVAGVKEITVCVPTPRNVINPYVMAALHLTGIQEVYRIGGAQAVGAMAYGTETIKKVDKIVGPGNIYVALAKKSVFGEVDIDMIAGPSEVLIIADQSADPAYIAADLLSQAEHDELASSILITDSVACVSSIRKELARQLSVLPRSAIARQSIRNYGAIIVVKNLKEAAALTNSVAPEHLEILTKRPLDLLQGIRHAGAIFLGPWTPEPLGDYIAGPNHTLPTGGTARFFSPLGVYDFIKRSSLLGFSQKGFMKLADEVIAISDIEGLTAHGNTIRVRYEKE